MPRLAALFAASAAVAAVAMSSGCGGDSDAATQPDNPAGVIVSNVQDNTAFEGTEPAKPYTMPDVTLTDTHGDGFNLRRDTTTPVTLVFFGYTHCPDECPLVMSDTTAALHHLPKGVRDKVQLLFITTDPGRDTQPVLRQYLDRYDSGYVGLTGNLGTIKKTARDLGVAVSGKQRLPSGGYDVGHSTQVIGFRGDRAPVFWTLHTPVEEMAADIEKLAKQ